MGEKSPIHVSLNVFSYSQLQLKILLRIEYRSNDVTIFFFAFQHFEYIYRLSMMKNIHNPNLVGIGS